VREHERKDDLHAKLGEEAEENPSQLLLTEAPKPKRRRGVSRRRRPTEAKAQVKAQRKPAHVRRTRKVAPPVEAPAPVVKVSRGRDIFGNTPNPYAYADAMKAYYWVMGQDEARDNFDILKEKGSDLELKGNSFQEVLNNLSNWFKQIAAKGGKYGAFAANLTTQESKNLFVYKTLLGERLVNTLREYQGQGKFVLKYVQEGFAQGLKDEKWKKKNVKRINAATKRLQRRVTVKGNLTQRALNKIIHSGTFKAWFGDWESATRSASHVVDEMRKPKEQREIVVPSVVYHGTPQKKGFTWFDPEKGKSGNFFGPGLYFTSDFEVAKGYAENYLKIKHSSGTPKPRIKSLRDAEKIKEIAAELKRRGEGALAKGRIEKKDLDWLQLRINDFTNDAKKDRWMDEFGNTNRIYALASQKVRDAIDMENYFIAEGQKPYLGAIYTVFLNIRNPYNLDEVVDDKEIDEILKTGLETGKDYNEFYLKHLWDNVTSKGLKEFEKWMISSGRRDKMMNKYGVSEGRGGLSDVETVRKVWEILNKYYEGTWNPAAGKHEKTPLKQFKPGGKSGVLTRQMLFRMLSDWGSSDRGANLYTNYIKSKGYDGITHTGGWNIGTKDHKVWIAFEPEQVKSTLNEGTFNPDDPDMFKGVSHARRT